MMKRPNKTSLYSVVLFSEVIDGRFHIAHPNWQQIQQCHHLATLYTLAALYNQNSYKISKIV